MNQNAKMDQNAVRNFWIIAVYTCWFMIVLISFVFITLMTWYLKNIYVLKLPKKNNQKEYLNIKNFEFKPWGLRIKEDLFEIWLQIMILSLVTSFIMKKRFTSLCKHL